MLAQLCGESIEGESRELDQEKQNVSQEGANKVSATRKLSVILYYALDLSDYKLDLLNFAGTSNMLSDACIA